MRVRKYLEKLEPLTDVTFIKARARKDAHTPFYHCEYQETPIYMAKDWLKNNQTELLDSIILNDKQMPIQWLSGADWTSAISNGRLKCLLVISEEDCVLLFSKAQQESLEEYIEDRIKI